MQPGWQNTVMLSACDTAMRRNEVDEEFRAEQVAAARRARGVAAAALPLAADQGLSHDSAAARPDATGRPAAPQDAGPLPAHVAREVLRALVDPEVPCTARCFSQSILGCCLRWFRKHTHPQRHCGHACSDRLTMDCAG